MYSLSWLQLLTLAAYVFVIVAYIVKVRKYFKMPQNLRWDLYPIPHEKGYKYGGSYFEELDFWTKPRHINRARDIMEMAKQYFTMWGYYARTPSYWFGLFPWHIGFYCIVAFHGFVWIDAIIANAAGIEIGGESANVIGQILYYVTLGFALTSFILGTIGSVILLMIRIFDRSMRDYAAPQNYFNYVFCLVLFVSGLLSWAFADPTFHGYREFWKGIMSLESVGIGGLEALHVFLFALFLFYLPFTRSTHYITMLLTYFKIRWNDAPNYGSEEGDSKLQEALSLKVGWEAPHIQTGENWGAVVSEMPKTESDTKK